jgi:hypothetical protein
MEQSTVCIKQIRKYFEDLSIFTKNMEDEQLINFLLESHKRQHEIINYYTNKSKNYNLIQKFISRLLQL